MTDVDRTGERGYHQIIIILGEEGQTERHEKALSQLNQMKPEHIKEIEILNGDAAEEQFGERAAKGAILVKTNPDVESYNTTLTALGMNADRSITDLAENSDSAEEPEDFFVVVEEMPELIGGLASIQKNITYPEMARRAGIEGRVYVQFIVNEQGEVERPKVIRGIGGGADEEALRAVKQAKFKPGIQRGQPVRVQYSLPVVFRLQKNNDKDGQTSSNDISAPKGSLIVHGYGHFEKPEGTVIEPATLTGHRQLESGKSGIQIKRVLH
ncbi:MAG: TonB family protein, partial [Bacteroidetes bacterium]|jgi:TonB family protein|nr:TonB family protein [Bacteroidota bacterium]